MKFWMLWRNGTKQVVKEHKTEEAAVKDGFRHVDRSGGKFVVRPKPQLQIEGGAQ